jgi:hypothetical protein
MDCSRYFGISLNCKFGTDKAARHGGYRAAQLPAPTSPVGTCRHHQVPVGTDVGTRTADMRPTNGSLSIRSNRPVADVDLLPADDSIQTLVACRQSIGVIKCTDQTESVLTLDAEEMPTDCLPAVCRHHVGVSMGPH